MAALSADFLRELQRSVREFADNQEQNQNVVVTDEARTFLVGIIVESVIYRRSEWMNQAKIDVSNANDLMNVVPSTRGAIRDLLDQAPTVRADGGIYVCVISLIQAIQAKWCGVWPFCRK